MADAIDVLVVGGGPVGLALGSALGRAGLAVTVLERRDAPDPRPKASHVHGPVLEGLACAGVTETDLEAGRPMFGARHRHRDRLVAEVDTRVAPGRWPWSLALPQPELEAVLEGHARAAGVTIVRGADVVAVDVDAPSVEAVVGGERARFAGTWVVGC
ncbi:MAG: FAD-dependent monooxygenase, partial [Myxococcales bacterium]|nr:FAD-dependent monooxygenase [Myxococcales bacterium]